MVDTSVDERTSLLHADQEASDVEQRRQSYENTLRRISSANLPPYHEEHTFHSDNEPTATATIWTIVPVSLLGELTIGIIHQLGREVLTATGVFVANLDGSLIIASSQQIASEFNALSGASWLITSFILALSASQPLVNTGQCLCFACSS